MLKPSLKDLLKKAMLKKAAFRVSKAQLVE